jgi:methanogenic corrinoid protein MtbC1
LDTGAATLARRGRVRSGSMRKSVRAGVRSFLRALLDSDRASAMRIAKAEYAALGSRAALFAEIIHPAQYEIGELWYRGEIGVADEHRATAIVETIVDQLPPGKRRAQDTPRSCLLAAVRAEEHVVGLHMLAAALTDDGWAVQLLAKRTPVDHLLKVVDRERPMLVCLSAGYLPEIGEMSRTIRLIKARGIPVLVGGAAFNRNAALAERVGADAHGQDVRVALTLARRLVGS